MNAKKIIKDAMSNTGYTLTRLAKEVSNITGQNTTVQNISNKLQRNTVKVYELEQWLNVMGYTIDYKHIEPYNIPMTMYHALSSQLPTQDLHTVMLLLNNDDVPVKCKEALRNKVVHNNTQNIRHIIAEFISEATDYINIDNFF